MPRIRTIKPSFFFHEELSLLPPETHLLAAGLLCYADDEGYFHAHPKLVQAAVFPIRELSGEIPEMLRSLQEIGYIDTGKTPDGKVYGRVVKFDDHQKVSHPTGSVIKKLQINWCNSGKTLDSSGENPEQYRNDHETLRPELNRSEFELDGVRVP
jgi:hypothetical protein